MRRIYPRILVLASRFDLSCDYVIAFWRQQGIDYLRLNTEDLSDWDLTLDPISPCLTCRRDENSYILEPSNLKSIWFRRPVYLRDYGFQGSVADQIVRVQWAAFVRSLIIFEQATWINHPQATYLAEHKALQLNHAARLGFLVPQTLISNSLSILPPNQCFALKGLDTVLARNDAEEYFGFTQLINTAEIASSSTLKECAVVIQQGLTSKLDLRVTVVGDQIFPVAVTLNGMGIYGDWRLNKDHLEFRHFNLPSEIAELCKQITREFGLKFAAIDLALVNNQFYFIELNPTGEWAWLVDHAAMKIDEAIANELA